MARSKAGRANETPARRGQPSRLNDTRAITNDQLGANVGASHSISTCKIDNGYLVEESFCNPQTGEYRSSKRFSSTPPRIIPGRAVRITELGANGDPLLQAVEYMGSRGLGEKA